MSTRANIIFRDSFGDEIYFYRHSDGYPEATGEDLLEFCQGYYHKNLRDNAGQSAGWLVVRGHLLMKAKQADWADRFGSQATGLEWKVGYYEPASKLQCDVEYIYVIDLENMVLEIREVSDEFFDAPSLEKTKILDAKPIDVPLSEVAK